MIYYIQVITNSFYNSVVSSSVGDLPFDGDQVVMIPDVVNASLPGWVPKTQTDDSDLLPTVTQAFSFNIYNFSVESTQDLLGYFNDYVVIELDASSVPSLLGEITNIEGINTFTSIEGVVS